MDALAGYGSSDDEGSTKSEQTSDAEEDKLLQVEVGESLSERQNFSN